VLYNSIVASNLSFVNNRSNLQYRTMTLRLRLDLDFGN
jgi:hypothetical protein